VRKALVLAVVGTVVAASAAFAAGHGAALTKCTMDFTLKGWSAVYKTAHGTGRITCDNGDAANARIKVAGGGLTFGKTQILNGKAVFSGVKGVEECFGRYAAAQAHAGVVKSGEVGVYTRGEVSMAVSGTGRGVDIGIDFGEFRIERPKP
jgi:hypothetical protein